MQQRLMLLLLKLLRLLLLRPQLHRPRTRLTRGEDVVGSAAVTGRSRGFTVQNGRSENARRQTQIPEGD